jgi:ABC-2 type transport system ATP-binding protein
LLGLNWRTGANELRQRIGIQLQETQFPDKLTVEETLRLFRSFLRRGISVEESIGRRNWRRSENRAWATLGGQKQRLAMACALVGDPELLFLDEPTTGLDPQARRHLWDLVDGLKQAGRTIILTTHYMEEAERLCDRVAIMDHGKVIALGTPQQLIATVGGEDIVEFAVSSGEPGGHQRPCRGRCGRADGDFRRAVASRGCGAASAFGQRTAHWRCRASLPRSEPGLHLSEFRTHSATLEDVFVG